MRLLPHGRHQTDILLQPRLIQAICKSFKSVRCNKYTHTHTLAVLYIVRGTQVPCVSHINISVVTQTFFRRCFTPSTTSRHFWCKCAGYASTCCTYVSYLGIPICICVLSLLFFCFFTCVSEHIPANKCQAKKGLINKLGSCSNSVVCPRSDGTCGINVSSTCLGC